MVKTGEGGKRAGSILFFQLRLIITKKYHKSIRLIITKNITNLLSILQNTWQNCICEWSGPQKGKKDNLEVSLLHIIGLV